jgi:hypothetical protein
MNIICDYLTLYTSEISIETGKYSDNIPSKNEKTVKENEEIAGHTRSDGRNN